MDRKEAQQIQAEFKAALEPIAKAHGLELGKSGATYDPAGSIRLRITMAAPGESAEARALREIGGMYGLEPSDAGRTFRWGPWSWQLVGLRPNAPKHPILAIKVASGRLHKLPMNAAPAIARAAGRTLTPTQEHNVISN